MRNLILFTDPLFSLKKSAEPASARARRLSKRKIKQRPCTGVQSSFRWFINLSTRQECRVLNKACVKLLECIFHRGGKCLLLFLLFSQDLTTAKLVFVVASLSCKKFNITGKHTNTTTKRFRTLEHREQIYRNELPKNIYDENNSVLGSLGVV